MAKLHSTALRPEQSEAHFYWVAMLKLLIVLPIFLMLAACGGGIDLTPSLNVHVGSSEPTYYDGGPYWHRPHWRHRDWW